MKMAILGGTFNPPHNGHLAAARNVQAMLELDKFLFIPANDPPHKALPAGSATTKQRIEMVRLAVMELPFADMSTMEIERGGRSYTVDTVRALHNRWQNPELYLVVGTDMLLSIDKWHMPRVLLSMCTLVAAARTAGDRAIIEEAARALREDWDAKILIAEGAPFEISSTQIRESLKDGKLEDLVPPRVADYIKEHKLYQ